MKRVVWGKERRLQKGYSLDHKNEQCPDCGVDWMHLHLAGCSVEECPYCGHELIECGHAKRFLKNWKPVEKKKGFLSRLFGWG